ncbi:hypothetical protein [Terrimonas alba]|uniref:hypothetical protein n=1 Tax=Terrimonas alba TaxID=3349636 RepID=UPI0035F39E78
MYRKLIISLLFCLLTVFLFGQEPARRTLRIADTLTAKEKAGDNTVLLRSELDSLIQLYMANQPQKAVNEPTQQVPQENELPLYLLIIGSAVLLVVAFFLYKLFRSQEKFRRTVLMLNRQIQHLEMNIAAANMNDNAVTGKKSKLSVNGMEKKIQALTSQLEATVKEKEEMEEQLAGYINSKQDFDLVKQQMMEVYKIRNYPGFNKEKSETEIVRSLLDTERSVALYAYEHFLKPVLAIADANKNNPAKINAEEREKLLNLLISLSLLYSEYLYLRIGDLSIGGKIVERIGNLKNGNQIDPASLKELNTEHGSRALVLRMVLDKSSIQNLSYPVFDETNLNLS